MPYEIGNQHLLLTLNDPLTGEVETAQQCPQKYGCIDAKSD
jgi:hypothetical protein